MGAWGVVWELGHGVSRNVVLGCALVVLGVVVWWRRPDAARVASAGLATAFAVVLIVVASAVPGGWVFVSGPTTWWGVPVDAVLGWALLWAAVPVLVGGPAWLWVVGLLWVDVLTMPLLGGLVSLGVWWLWVDVVLVVLVVVPCVVFGRVSAVGCWLGFRVVFQGLTAAGVLGWLVPGSALAVQQGTSGLASWGFVAGLGWWQRGLLVMVLVVVLVPALSAVVELAVVGGGTPFPWDPPVRLVTSGPYAFVGNPMQCGVVGLYVVLGVAARSWELGVAAVVGCAFSVAVAEFSERSAMAAQWPEYGEYRAVVWHWWPRWRPVLPGCARVWVDELCGQCVMVGDGLFGLGPVGVQRCSARCSPVVLRRLTWECGGVRDEGVAAVGRVLERVNVVLAWVGWLVRLPVVVQVVGVVADVFGFGAQRVGGRSR